MTRFPLLLADLILVVHFLFITFVVGGQAAILVGHGCGWHWVRRPAFRWCHLLAIMFVVAQAWAGRWCPLTLWENHLRQAAGAPTYQETFIQHWLSRLVFVDVSPTRLTILYTLFGLVVLGSWILIPPRRRADLTRFPERIVSGGQTGVDRAALDVARERGIPCGGWCPRGRLSEAGPIPADYPLAETPSADYAQRTEWNIRDSDATLALSRGEPTGGTALTVALARQYGRPYRIIDLDAAPAPFTIQAWLTENKIRTLNIAGPRESTAPGIHTTAVTYLRELFPSDTAADLTTVA